VSISTVTASFTKLASGLDVRKFANQLTENPHHWGAQTARIGAGSPHYGSTDIWLRYRDLDEYTARNGNDMSAFCDEHKSVWLAPTDDLDAAIPIVAEVIDLAGGGELGGVLLTRLEPGGKIAPHVDYGWHAEVHEKYYVAIKTPEGSLFCWDDGVIEAQDGDVWWFRNDVSHWVENNSDRERIAMIVCLKRVP